MSPTWFLLSLLLLVTGCTSHKQDEKKGQEKTIHHLTYGDYPATVPFEQGMTLMPEQSAEMVIEIPIPDGLLEGICLRDGGSTEQCAKYR